MNKITFVSVSSDNGSKLYRIHLIFPEQEAPWQRTNLLNRGESAEIFVKKGPFFVVVHKYAYDKLIGRDFSVIDLRQNFLDFGTYVLHYQLEKAQIYSTNEYFFAEMQETANVLNQYTQYELKKLQESRPVQKSLELTHSISYEFESNPKMNIPYVALVGRGEHLIKGIPIEEISKWQRFFIGFMPKMMQECSFSPANFCRVSKQQNLEPSERFFVYNAIATVFSHIVGQRIQYKPDSEATFLKDYVGLNVTHNEVYGDCEDQAQFVYDLVRIFKGIFPTSAKDRFRGSTSLCYVMSHWLQAADLWIIQGAVGPNADVTHVWCSLFPQTGGPAHYIETTGNPSPNFYKFLIRAWQMSKNKEYQDVILKDPNTSLYGLGSAYCTSASANAYTIFQKWANRNQRNIDKALRFATLMDAPLYHPMSLIMQLK